MAKWLYSSSGEPIAFINGNDIFSYKGIYIGRLDGTEVWHGTYKGEIVKRDLLLFKSSKSSNTRGSPGTPGSPGIPGRPGSRGAGSVPSGYRDIDLDE